MADEVPAHGRDSILCHRTRQPIQNNYMKLTESTRSPNSRTESSPNLSDLRSTHLAFHNSYQNMTYLRDREIRQSFKVDYPLGDLRVAEEPRHRGEATALATACPTLKVPIQPPTLVAVYGVVLACTPDPVYPPGHAKSLELLSCSISFPQVQEP